MVFDDIRPDASQFDPIKEYFFAGRQRGTTAVFLAQSYFDMPKYIRRNAGCLIFMVGLDHRDVLEIAADRHFLPICRGQLEAAYQEATAEPFSYFVIDNTADPILLLRFRKRFLVRPQGGEPLC
ncbi:MAG: hypothetical protein AB2556_18555 [Candidatus Thiodiazotropha sp.]